MNTSTVKQNIESNGQANRTTPEEEYLSSLQGYLQGDGEFALHRAYEIGRAALAAGVGPLAITRIHHVSVEAMLLQSSSTQEHKRILNAAANFFAECISPYEMTYTAFRETNVVLRHFNEVLEQEAKRIAHALHNEAGQLLVAVYIALENMAQEMPAARTHITKVAELLDQIEVQLRRLSHELTPAMLNDLGLGPALQYLVEGLSQRFPLQIAIHDAPRERLPRSIESALYRIVQESLNNVVRHSQATEVSIRFQLESSAICCSIRDNGIGFDLGAVQKRKGERGFGLSGIRERARVLGGTVQINPAIGSGTELVVCVPIEKSAEN
jgi:signal transduction histidine kinase